LKAQFASLFHEMGEKVYFNIWFLEIHRIPKY
jgi:hypothetical protein